MSSVEQSATIRRRHGLGFWGVAFAFAGVMAFSTLPSPLYGLLEARDGFGSFTVTLVYAVYAVGVLASLVFLGHVSDTRGRRRLLLPALVVAVLSAAVFLLWRDLPGLFVARIVNGLSVGVVTATATVYLTELYAVRHPGTDGRRAQVVAITANLGGLGLGPLVSGSLAQWGDHPLTLPFVVFLVVLVLALALVAVAPETRERVVPPPPYRPQRVSVPDASRGRFFAAAAGSFMAFGAIGLFTALAATFLAGTLHHPSHALAGATVSLMFIAGAIAQTASASLAVRRLLGSGIAILAGGLALMTLAAWLPSPSLALFLLGGATVGAGAGMVLKGTVGTVIAIAPPAQRGEALAGLFVAGYLGISVPVVGAGIALQVVSARTTLLGFALLVGAGLLAVGPRLVRGEAPAVAAPQPARA